MIINIIILLKEKNFFARKGSFGAKKGILVFLVFIVSTKSKCHLFFLLDMIFFIISKIS